MSKFLKFIFTDKFSLFFTVLIVFQFGMLLLGLQQIEHSSTSMVGVVNLVVNLCCIPVNVCNIYMRWLNNID